MDKDVKNVKRASEAVGKFVAPEVTLANGDAVTVNKLGWKGFREMFSSISQIVQLYFEHNNAQEKSTEIAMGSFVIKNQLEIADEATESTVEQAKTDAQKAFQRLAEKIIDAPDIVEKLVEFMEFVEVCPRGGEDWVQNFIDRCKDDKKQDCEKCMYANLKDFKKEKRAMLSTEETITVADLKPKQKGVVIKINRRGAIAKRLAEMGIGRGTVVEFERVAPLGDPIDIKVKGYHLTLRKSEAADIEISRR